MFFIWFLSPRLQTEDNVEKIALDASGPVSVATEQSSNLQWKK